MTTANTETTVKLDGITYQAERFGDHNTPCGLPMYSLTKIGKRGKVTVQHRPAALHPDGTWLLGCWN